MNEELSLTDDCKGCGKVLRVKDDTIYQTWCHSKEVGSYLVEILCEACWRKKNDCG